MPKKFPQDRPDYSLFSKVWSIGSGIVILTLIGYWLDQKFHTTPVWMLAGAGLGVMYCFFEAWQAYKKE
jgi:F0F1-type ATP synthase assembly protein I